MTRTAFGDVIEVMVEALAAQGYRRDRQLFVKPVGDNWAVLHVQRSDASDASAIKVTANVGASLSAILRFGGRRTGPRSYADLHWEVRIGELLPERTDRWWWIEIEQLPDSARAFADVVATVGATEAERHADPARLRSLWLAGPMPFLPEVDRLTRLSILLLEEGRSALLDATIEQLRSAARGTWQEGEVEELVQRLRTPIASQDVDRTGGPVDSFARPSSGAQR